MIRYLAIALSISVCSAHAQSKKLAVFKTFGGAVYELNDSVTISVKQVSMLIQSSPEAYKEFKIAKRKNNIAAGFGFLGGVLTAIPLITAAAGGQPEWIYAAIGGGLILCYIPFLSSYRGHAVNAVDIYNKSQTPIKARIQPSLFISGQGVGLQIRF